MASPAAALAAEGLELAASKMVLERGPVLPAADRASVPETSEAFGGIGFITVASIISCSSAIRSFLVIRSFMGTDTGTIHTGIIPTAIRLTGIPTAISLTDIIHLAMGTALTINPVTLGVRRAEVPRLWISSVVWRVRAITMVGSTESWVLEHALQCALTNARMM